VFVIEVIAATVIVVSVNVGVLVVAFVVVLAPAAPATGSISSSSSKKGAYTSSSELCLRATGRHLPYGITQFYLSTDTRERTPS